MIISYGYTFARLQGRRTQQIKECYYQDMRVSLLVASFSIIPLIIILVENNYKYGFKFK